MKRILETERLYLREFVLDDAQKLIDLNDNPNVIKYTGDGAVENIEKAKEILQNIIFPQYPNKLGRWAVHLKEGDTFIGWCGLKFIAELNEIDLGYRFFEEHWKKGYATECAKACLNFGFNILDLKEIVARAAIANVNSIKVLEKIGMRFEKEAEEHGDSIYKYRLSNSQYKARF